MNTKKQKSLMNFEHNFWNKNRYILWISILIGGISIGISINSYYTQEPIKNPVTKVFSIGTLDIAKHFVCSCGSCGEKELIACLCPTAMETKQFIETSLNNGISIEDVTDIVKVSIGHYKG